MPIIALANNSALVTNQQYSIGLDLGVGKPTNLGSATTFPLGYSTFSYSPNGNDVYPLIAGISISKILTIDPFYTLQAGVSAHYISRMNVKGDLEQGISPPYYQANYSYNMSSYQYLVDAKLRRQFYERYFPYIYLGLGMAFNKAYDYSISVPGYLTVTPEYSTRTTNSFTYSLGLGMDYFVMPTLSIGVGYRFINLGKVGLGPGVINNTNVSAKLTQSHLYINTVLAQLNYFI
jgi:opacity protein-like surface antigen